MTSVWPMVSFEKLVRLERRPVEVIADSTYQEIGTYSYGRGIFHKKPRSGLEVGDKDLFLMREGDLILQVTFAWEGAIALCSEAENGLYGSVRYPTFRVSEEKCYPPYLRTYLCSRAGLEKIAAICPGSAGRNRVLALKRLPEVLVPLPPLGKQREIMAAIDNYTACVSEAKRIRDESRGCTDALHASALSKLFEAQDRTWTHGTVADVTLGVDAGWSPQCSERPAVASEWGVLKTTAVQWCEFNSEANKALPDSMVGRPDLSILEGDVLVTRAGPRKRVGVVAAARSSFPKLMISDKIIRLRPDKNRVDPRFMELALASPHSQEHLVKRKTGLADAQVNISQSILKSTPFAYPSLVVQQEIVKRMEVLQAKVDQVKILQDESDKELEAVIPAILDRAFSGRLL